VHVRATDGCLQDADEHIITADYGNRNLLEPETRLRFGFDNRFHRPLHDGKVFKSAERGKIFAKRRMKTRSGMTAAIVSFCGFSVPYCLDNHLRFP
jgi:hypothetical protein